MGHLDAVSEPTMLPELDNIDDIASSDTHVCAYRSDGATWCWGANGNGQIGNGTTIEQLTPVELDFGQL